MIKKKIYYFLILATLVGCSNKPMVPQTKPFENFLISVKEDSTDLFKNSFSERIHNENNDTLTWDERLIVTKDKLKMEYVDVNPKDFSFEFDKYESDLIIMHKSSEPFRMKVIMENGSWKLDEH